MKGLWGVIIVLLASSNQTIANTCEEKFSDTELQQLKQQHFEVAADDIRNETAVNLLACLGHQDPTIRDGVVYEATSQWLRAGLLEQQTTHQMFVLLTDVLEQPNQDKANFTQPFAALVLSEVVRVDRISPYLTDDERQRVVDISTAYLHGISDYRGYDDKDGWRHAVAHTADIFLQLALNESVSKAQLDQVLAAIQAQVSPSSSHFYVYGEPKRLAMPFIYILLRDKHSDEEVSNLLVDMISPKPFDNWGSVYNSNEGLAKLHNTRSFVYSLVAITGKSNNPKLKAMQPTLIRLTKELG